MNKHLLLLLLGFGSFCVVADEDDSITRTALYCEYIKNTFHINPSQQIAAWNDESILITDIGDSVDWLWIDMYGFRYSADKNNTVITWTATDQNFETWKYVHTLNRYTGKLEIDHHVPVSKESGKFNSLDLDKDGVIVQATHHFNCRKSEALF